MPHSPGDCDIYAVGLQESGVSHVAWDGMLRVRPAPAPPRAGRGGARSAPCASLRLTPRRPAPSPQEALGHQFVRVDSRSLHPGGWITLAVRPARAAASRRPSLADSRPEASPPPWARAPQVFIRRGLAPYVSQVRTDAVSCGIGNVVGNKARPPPASLISPLPSRRCGRRARAHSVLHPLQGGVAVSFLYGGTRFAFVNCHLAAHTHGTADRNRDYARLASTLLAGTRGCKGCGPQPNRVVPFHEPDPLEPASSSGEGLLQGHDAVVWMARAPLPADRTLLSTLLPVCPSVGRCDHRC